jgi:GNAT superfamily N-acetyltransferase
MGTDMTDITFAARHDLPAIHDMVRALSAFHGEVAAVTYPELEKMFFGAAPMAKALITKQNGAPVGYAGLTPTMVIHDGRLRIDIHHLFIHDGHRVKGIGTALIAAAKDFAISVVATRLTIGTDPDNATSIAAYTAMPDLQEMTGGGPRFRVNLEG